MDKENTLYIDLKDGRVTIQMRPDLAPRHVAQIKKLAREGKYDGVVFHRVIDGFMAQTGDPDGTGMGGMGERLPAAVDLEQGQVVGEVARRDLAFDLGEGGAGAGEVDRHDAVAPLAAVRLGRLAAFDHLEPVGARKIRRLAVGADAVEMRG